MNENATIATISTGKGKGAIAIIRITGPKAFPIVEKCITPQKVFKRLPSKTIHLFNFFNNRSQQVIDQITAVKYMLPRSFTGEDMVEIFCHGGELVVEKILSVLVDEGAVLAKKGEFTKRAYANGKLDLMQAEAIRGIIESRSEKEFETSITTYFGGYKAFLLRWKQKIKDIIRDIEAEIEFPEKDDVQRNNKNHKKEIIKIRKEIELELKNRKKLQMLENGMVVPIVGITNAGKSSLFNLLLECERSIVHWEDGTTRDSIGEDFLIAGEKVRLFDTAGLRDAQELVEKTGIQKTWDYIKQASLVIWVTPADRETTFHEKVLFGEKAKGKTVCIVSKEDIGNGSKKKELCKKNKIPCIGACLLNKDIRAKLVKFIGKQIEKSIGSIEISNVISNKRHESIAKRMAENLLATEKQMAAGEEIQVYYLRKVLSDIGEFIGETTTEEIVESIFSEFCVGK